MVQGIVLGGFMGTGKSTVGRVLAQHTGWPWVDTDDRLEATFGPCGEQFQHVGEPTFRDREHEVLRQVLETLPAVISTGGGVWPAPRNRQLIEQAPVFGVVLTASWDEIVKRVGRGTSRPLFDHNAQALHRRRAASYRVADLCVDTTDRSPEDVAQEILQCLP